ncbi:MAG: HNH endonuclease [Actinomycetota bacterium]|nr:HNH endonuclease [Actinomycetota bacterium]
MLAQLTAACQALGDTIAATDPDLLSGVDCAQLAELLARTEKRCAALRALAAARAAHCGAHKTRGYSNAATWLAQITGTTTGEARAALDTADRLDDCADTKEALRAGQVSLTQAAAITATATAVAGTETELLALAGRAGVAELKDEARRQRLQAQDPEQQHRQQHRDRSFRHWVDQHGMIRLSGALPPDIGVPVVSRVDTETDRLARQGRRHANRDTASDGDGGGGQAEPREALAADALAQLILGGGQPKARSAELVLVCDIAAFQRGHTEPGEICHIIGGGPVPVSVAVELATAAFIKAVLHNGVRIHAIAHYGRYIPAHLRTALNLGDPPLFTGAACVDCGRRYGLQWDHFDPLAHHGPTSYDNLGARCWPCHQDKTDRDRQAGLLTPHPPTHPNPNQHHPKPTNPKPANPDPAIDHRATLIGETASAPSDNPPTGAPPSLGNQPSPAP